MKTLTLRESSAPYTLTVDNDFFGQEPVILQRDGRPVVVIIPIAEYEALRARPAMQQGETQMQGPGAVAGNRAAFLAMKGQLLQSHSGQYVAFKDGQLVGADSDDRALVKRLYHQFGVVPLYVKLVEDEEHLYHLSSPRKVR